MKYHEFLNKIADVMQAQMKRGWGTLNSRHMFICYVCYGSSYEYRKMRESMKWNFKHETRLLNQINKIQSGEGDWQEFTTRLKELYPNMVSYNRMRIQWLRDEAQRVKG